MEKLKVSASQIAKFRRCRRAYAFEYVEHFWPPASPKQQFGTDVHAHLEKWISEAQTPPSTPSGALANLAITSGHIPVPDERLLCENKFVYRWSPSADVGGFIDLTLPPHMSDARIPTIIDYKTTSDLRWAKTPEQLAVDEQAILYAIQAMLEWDACRVKCKWVYLAATAPRSGNRKPKGAKSCEIVFDVREPLFLAKVRELDKDIREIVRIRHLNIKGRSLQASPESCEMFGGCHHKARCQLSSEDVLGAFIEKDTLQHNKT